MGTPHDKNPLSPPGTDLVDHYAVGHQAFKPGKPPKVARMCKTPEHQRQWMQGWMDAQAEHFEMVKQFRKWAKERVAKHLGPPSREEP